MYPPKNIFLRLLFRLFDAASTVVVGFAYFIFYLQPRSRPFVLASTIGRLIRGPLKWSVRRKMQLVFADRGWNKQQFRRFWRAHLQHVGLTVLEPIHIHRMSIDQLRERIAVEGEEYVRAALKEGRGAMLFINHLGDSGCVPAYLARAGYDITVAGDPMPVPYLERKAQQMYRTVGAERILRGDRVPLKAAQAFRRNGLFATYTDLSLVRKQGEWLRFGPAEIQVNLGPAIVAIRHRVTVLYANSARLGNNHHRIVIHPPLWYDPHATVPANALSLMRQATALLLEEVRARPEQWWALDFVCLRVPKAGTSTSLSGSSEREESVDQRPTKVAQAIEAP